MSEEKKKEPKVIHVDKLIIKADEVILKPEHEHRPPHAGPDFRKPGEERRVPRDFWGFPLRPIERSDEDKKEKDEKKEKDKKKD